MHDFLKRHRKIVAFILVTILIIMGVYAFLKNTNETFTINRIFLSSENRRISPDNPVFDKGEVIRLVTEVSGFAITSQHVARLTMDIILRGPEGDILFAKDSYREFKQFVTNTDTLIIETTLLLPANNIPEGTFNLLVRIHDGLRKNFFDSVEIPFSITSNYYLNIHSLSILNGKNILLERNDEVFPGETLTMQGEISGFRLDHNNQCTVTVEAQLQNEAGTKIGNPVTLINVSQTIDPTIRSILINNTIIIPKTLRPGHYNLNITINDHIQQKKTTTLFPFSVKSE